MGVTALSIVIFKINLILKLKSTYYFFILLISLSACHETYHEKKHKKLAPKPVKKNIPKRQASDWVELQSLDSSFVYDIRYATINNFVHKKMYPCAKCYVRRVVAEALLKVQKELRTKSLRLKLFDCYRPGKVQKALWAMRPDPRYVADPKKGSMHNRGLAVDLTIVDANGKELNMGTTFDYFGKKAYHSYKKLPDTVLKNRLFLKNIMQKYDLEPITSEWWHYSYRKKTYPVAQWIWQCP